MRRGSLPCLVWAKGLLGRTIRNTLFYPLEWLRTNLVLQLTDVNAGHNMDPNIGNLITAQGKEWGNNELNRMRVEEAAAAIPRHY